MPQDSHSRVASAAPNDPANLAHFDLGQLSAYRELTEKHLRSALSSITAAADPSQYISQVYLNEFEETAYLTWAEMRGLVGAMFGDLPTPLLEATVTEAVTQATKTYGQLLESLIGRKAFGIREPIYGEFTRATDSKSTVALVQPGDVRPLLATLGGGSTDVTIPLTGSITSGQTMTDWLRSNGITSNQKIWLYGFESEPRRTFNGHLQMDGLVFQYWDDPGLKIAPQDAWIRRRFYAPGDHWGCACVVAPYIPNFGDDYQLHTPTV